MGYIRFSTSTAMEKWSKGQLYIFGSVLVYIILYALIRESSLINDELALYHYLKNESFWDLWKLNWSDAFKFTYTSSLEETPYYRPILNYIYYLGFEIYTKLCITPLVINWSLLFYLGITIRSYLKSNILISNCSIIAAIYLLLPFNFEAALFFPNLSDIIIHIVAIKIFIYFTDLKSINYKHTLILYLVFILSFLIKEAALILIMIPLASFALNRKNTNLFEKKNIKYVGIFLLSFISYYIFRTLFTDSNNLDLSIMALATNYIKGIYNFIFLTQDINLSAIILIPTILGYYIYAKNKNGFFVIVCSIIIISPVAILQPDDRFFHIAYFIVFIFFFKNRSKKSLKLLLFMLFVVFIYKVYSNYNAHIIREKIKKEVVYMNISKDNTLIAILPYRHGNEAEIFLNGTNYYLNRKNIIPVLVKEKYLWKNLKVNLLKAHDTTIIESESKVFIPLYKNNYTHIILNVNIKSETNEVKFWKLENKDYFIVNFLNKFR